MMHKWLLIATVLVFVKHTTAPRVPSRPQTVLPLTKSFGIAKPKLNRHLNERLGQEYVEQYHDMLKASQESFEEFNEKKLRRVIGDDDLRLMAEAGGLPRRRSASKLQSETGRRRGRSQAVRREKLQVQGMKSHKLHSKQTDLEYNYD